MTPDRIAWKVTPEMVREWQLRFFAREAMPPPLAGHEIRIVRQPVDEGPWIFEFLEPEDVSELDHPPGIRVWEPQDDIEDDLFASVRRLGDETPHEPAAPAEPGAPSPRAKRLLRADDDEDF